MLSPPLIDPSGWETHGGGSVLFPPSKSLTCPLPMSDTQSVMPTGTILPTVQTDMGQSQTEQHVEQAIPVVVSSPMSSEVAQQNKPILQSNKTVVETERRYPLRIRKPPKRLEL